MTGKEKSMSCADFQKELPYMFESGGEITHEHPKSCEDCRSLVQDLQYIADQAKLLLPMHDPSPRVWNNIQTSLSKDGLIANEQDPQRGHKVAAQKKNNLNLGLAAAAAAVLLVIFAVLQNAKPVQLTDPATASTSQEGFTDQDDAQLLSSVAAQAPDLKPVYAASLRDVNQYISDARSSLDADPSDDEARVHLRQAYAQKAMLYRMGTTRSFTESGSGQ